MSYFTSNVARAESEVLVKQVVVLKDKRGIPGSRDFSIQYSKVMVVLKHVFGAARHCFANKSRRRN